MSDIKRDPIGQKFYWVTNGEPHAIRRREILSKYGSKVRSLYGYDHRTAWQASGGGGGEGAGRGTFSISIPGRSVGR